MSLADLMQAPSDVVAPVIDRPATIGTITGYAALYYDPADPRTHCVGDDGEDIRLLPGAFDLAVKRGGVVALLNHKKAAALGSQASGTLRLTTDARGLRFEIDLPDTARGRRVLWDVEAGRVTGASLAYTPTRVYRYGEGGRRVIEAAAATVEDVGPVAMPRVSGCRCWLKGSTPDADMLAEVVALMDAELAAEDE